MSSPNVKMHYRRFGRTELQMPVFSCGGMRYQDGWRDKPLDEVDPANQKALEQTIERSMALGINHVETARGYGCSERQLGLILPRLRKEIGEGLILQTKIGPEDDPQKFTDNFHDSLKRLQLDYVDLLAIHGINDEGTLDKSVRPGGCFEAAAKLREAGLCRFIGFSTHGPPNIITEAIRYGEAATGKGFDYVNLHWYYIYQRNWSCIEEATRRDMGVFIISPTDKGGKLYDPPDKLVDLCKPLSPIVFNDLFCLSHQLVHTLSIGAARSSDFDEHLKALEVWDERCELLRGIQERLQAAMDGAVDPDMREAFNIGLPDWQSTPGGINIPIAIWLHNMAQAWDMVEFGKMRYNLLGGASHWFPGYRVDRLDLPDVERDLTAVLAARGFKPDRVIRRLREAHAMLGGEERKRLSQGG
jgi:predicted aldo/keto reductase-like oxidoreductase